MDILPAAHRGASRPRAGLSPPELPFDNRFQREPPFRPKQRTPGIAKEARMSNPQTPTRQLPVRPDLDQLKHQAKDLLRRIRNGDSDALAEFNSFHPQPPPEPSQIKLADAQLALARTYGASSWPRVVQSCKLIDAIWRDDLEIVRDLVTKHPNLIHENAGIRNNNWGPPLSYAANQIGRASCRER